MNVLITFVATAAERNLEVIRVARAMNSVQDPRKDIGKTALNPILSFLLRKQHSDGGWSDPEETAWAVGVLSQLLGKDSESVKHANEWFDNVRHPGGGWGRHPRDQVRIPTTALVVTLVPSIATDADREWVRRAWEKDLNNPVRLSYKGGFYLLTVNNENGEPIDPLVSRTIAYLAKDHNDDGGFGPWREHPIGSDPWSTGVVLWGLSKWIDRVDPQVIEKALAWLEKTQLPSGYWPYHYLDEGTSYALIGAVSAMRAMEGRK